MNKQATHARVNDQLYLDVRWARVFEDTDSPRKAQFSGDLCLNDGTKICTLNRLCILNTVDKETGESMIFIGSMSEKLSKGDTIYSVTWFPNAKYDVTDLKARKDFAHQCVKAVEAFQERDHQRQQNLKNAKKRIHPSLQGMTATAAKIRSLRGVEKFQDVDSMIEALKPTGMSSDR